MEKPTKAKALNLFASVWNTKHAIISRGVESAIRCTIQGQKGKEEQRK